MKRTADNLLTSYHELIGSLLPGCLGVGILDRDLAACGSRGAFDSLDFSAWMREQKWDMASCAERHGARRRGRGEFEIALALVDSTHKLIAVVGIALSESQARALGSEPGKALRRRLKPVLDCLHRELASAARSKSKVATLSERTRDLEWLFQVAAELKSASSNRDALERLLGTVAERMRCAFSALIVPAQNLLVQHLSVDASEAPKYEAIRAAAQDHVLAWARRHRRPLMINRAGTTPSRIPPCKLLAVPLMPGKGVAIGTLLFANPTSAADFVKRHGFLAADVARQAAQLLQSEYDLATGLLTRAGLEEAVKALPTAMQPMVQSVLHIDIDRLHVINNVHGFQAGDDVILRVAHHLGTPVFPAEALIARVAGDQFLAVLPNIDAKGAAAIASRLQQAVVRGACSTVPEAIEVTLSCGVAEVSSGPIGLASAFVSAEAACRAAKEHGRNRIETFTCDDASIIKRHGDARKMWALEHALKTDRFELFGQPIVPLSDPEMPSGYEVLLRLRNEEGTLVGPDQFLPAAQRYQMMPAIDRWVLDHTLGLLESNVGLLMRRRISISINVTGDSLGDAKFVDYLLSKVTASRFPARLLTVEITEQSAVRNLPAAASLMKRLRETGCGVALDDFGTGTNSLVYLRDLPVTRVKIDGSFVRDILNNKRAADTLKSIVELVRPFDVDTVAEYVEDQSVARRVQAMGVDYGQGYAFGKPESLAGAIRSLREDESRKLHRLALEI